MKRGNNIFRSLLFLAIISISVLIFSSFDTANAQDTNELIINEIYPSPADGEKEWVELYNFSDSTIDLSQYQLKDGGVGAKNLSGFVVSGSYYLFEVSSGWLNNAGDILYLIEIATNDIVDRVAYGNWDKEVLADAYSFSPDDNAPVPLTGQSISRIPNGKDSNIDKDDFRIITPTPGSENDLPKYPGYIKINEVVPTPANGSANEFVEIFNTGEELIDLSGWFLDDAESGSSPYKIPNGINIAPFGYLVFYNYESKISLNDTGDTVRLIDPNGEVKDFVNYYKANRGESFSKIDDNWVWTTEMTPFATNILVLPPADTSEESLNISISIQEAKGKEIGSYISVEGFVTVLPGVLGKQYFYIQDENSGVQIYNYWAKFPELKVGQRIKVLGEIAISGGEIRIKTVNELDIIILEEVTIQDPQNVSLYDISSDLVGKVVTVQGKVKSTTGANFVVSGSPEIKISIRESTGIKKPKMRSGDTVRITGVLSVYNGEFRILPFDIEGVKILTSGKLPVTGFNKVDCLWNLFQRVQSRQKLLLQRSLPCLKEEMFYFCMVI